MFLWATPMGFISLDFPLPRGYSPKALWDLDNAQSTDFAYAVSRFGGIKHSGKVCICLKIAP